MNNFVKEFPLGNWLDGINCEDVEKILPKIGKKWNVKCCIDDFYGEYFSVEDQSYFGSSFNLGAFSILKVDQKTGMIYDDFECMQGEMLTRIKELLQKWQRLVAERNKDIDYDGIDYKCALLKEIDKFYIKKAKKRIEFIKEDTKKTIYNVSKFAYSNLKEENSEM